MSDDPDDWTEGEWTRRLTLHQQRYGLPDRVLPDVIQSINRGVTTIDEDGGFVVRDPQTVTLALMEVDLQ